MGMYNFKFTLEKRLCVCVCVSLPRTCVYVMANWVGGSGEGGVVEIQFGVTQN